MDSKPMCEFPYMELRYMSDPDVPDVKNPEILIAKFNPRRTAGLIFYVIGITIFIVGWFFMIASSAQFIEFTMVAWLSGLWAMTVGILSILWQEIRRRYVLYIITSWNLRIRRGYYRKRTVRVFYDEIADVQIHTNREDRIVNQGDILVTAKGDESPTIVFEDIDNPRGIFELIARMRLTIEEPYPWSHIEKTRIAPY